MKMAAELVHLMSALDHDQSAVVCHDRGARVAYRLALDHPHKITRLAVLNIVPTIEEYERMSGGPSLGYWPLVPAGPTRACPRSHRARSWPCLRDSSPATDPPNLAL